MPGEQCIGVRTPGSISHPSEVTCMQRRYGQTSARYERNTHINQNATRPNTRSSYRAFQWKCFPFFGAMQWLAQLSSAAIGSSCKMLQSSTQQHPAQRRMQRTHAHRCYYLREHGIDSLHCVRYCLQASLAVRGQRKSRWYPTLPGLLPVSTSEVLNIAPQVSREQAVQRDTRRSHVGIVDSLFITGGSHVFIQRTALFLDHRMTENMLK